MTKLSNGNRRTLATLAAILMVSGVAFAQEATTADPYSGVSQPPPDSTIVANPDAQPAPPPAKPSPDVPAAAPDTAPADGICSPACRILLLHPLQLPRPPAILTTISSVRSPGQSAAPAASSEATLQTRPNPTADEDIVSAVPSSGNALGQGTNIRVKIADKLSTRETSVGSPFQGEVVKDVYKDGSVIIPAGSELKGRVIGVSQGHHFGSSATLRLRPDLVLLPDGTAYHLYAQVARSEAPGTRTDSEGGIQPKSQLAKNVAEYGVGAGTGAVIGAYAAVRVGPWRAR